jgi:GNAT superfamily N-acetyltransferase
MSEIRLTLTHDDPSRRISAGGARPLRLNVPLPSLPGMLRDWWHRLRASWRYAAALHELQMIDPRTLKDVGLHRGDLHAVAYATARRGAFGRFGAVRIRRVGLDDLPRCVQFGRLLHPEDVRLRFGRPAALGDGDTFRRLFGLDDGKIETIGAFDLNGQILGIASVAWVEPGTAESGLVVRSDLQRRGLGATLLAHVIKNARGAGFRLLLAHVDRGNAPIRRLAQRFGFEIAGTAAASTPAQLTING